ALLFSFLFFSSSRRRYTRSKRDWSSDVCSSDLNFQTPVFQDLQAATADGLFTSGGIVRNTGLVFGSMIALLFANNFKFHYEMNTTDLAYYARSEEHTSELQSRFDLVCRLLLEKKNKENSE